MEKINRTHIIMKCVCYLSFIVIARLMPCDTMFLPMCSSGTSWKTTQPSRRMCPDPGLKHVDAMGIHVNISFWISETSHSKKAGYLCRKLQLTTRCAYYWYFHSDISRIISTIPVTRDECLAKYQKVSDGEPSVVDISYPQPDCQWTLGVKVVDRSNIIYSLIEHPVEYDWYNDRYVDHILKDGGCRDYFCHTVSDHTMWILKPGETQCPRYNPVPGLLGTDVKTGKSVLMSPVFHKVPTTSLCKMNRCGKDLIASPNGFLFTVDNVDLSKRLSKCNASRATFKTITSQFNEVTDLMRLESQVQWLLCRAVAEDMRASSRINPRLLHVFQPQSPGTHPVYRYLKNGTLAAGTCNYVIGEEVRDPGFDSIGISSYGGTVEWLYWDLVDEKGCEAWGPNGIYRSKDCHIQYPSDKLTLASFLSLHDQYIDIQHPDTFTVWSNNSSLPHQLGPQSVGSKSVMERSILESAEEFFLYLWHTVVYWVIVFVTCVSLFFLAKWGVITWLFRRFGVVLALCRSSNSHSLPQVIYQPGVRQSVRGDGPREDTIVFR